ncbi:MAG TPA: hypothetical protein VHB48_07015, partial [Chitinophagaceae bacterium]|nr:hypothetical protein [Chitinophagaceae bacterium]
MRSLLLIWFCCICFNAICQTDSSDQDNTYPRRMGKVIQSTLPIPARVKKDGAWVRNPALDDYKNVPSGNGIKANPGGNLSSSSPSGRPGGIEQTEPGNPNNQTVNQPGAANANNQHENPYTEINLGPPGSDHEQNSRGSLSSSSSSGRPGSIQQTEPGNPENQTVNQPGAVNANNQHENPNTETNSVPPWGGIKQNPRGNFSSPPGRPGSIQQTATGNPDNPYTRPPANPHDEQGLPAENPGSI